MKKKALWKDIFREIKNSTGRFISIVLLITLGVFVYTGLKSVGPLMRKTADTFIDESNLADIYLNSQFSLEDKDKDIIKSEADIKDIEYVYSEDVLEKGSEAIINLESLPEKISMPKLIEGRMPENNEEIVVDAYPIKNAFNIGDVIEFDSKKSKFDFESKKILKNYKFKVVGKVVSAENMSTVMKGTSKKGLGDYDSFAYVLKSAFNDTDESKARIILNGLDGLKTTDREYKDIVSKNRRSLISAFNERSIEKFESIKADIREKIDDADEKIADAEKKLADAKKELDDAKVKLADAKKSYNDGKKKYNDSISEAEKTLSDNKKTLDESKETLDKNKADLDNAKIKLDELKSKLDELKETYESSMAEYTAKKEEMDKALEAMSGLPQSSIPADKAEEFKKGKEELEKAKTQLDELKETVDNLEITYIQNKAKYDEGIIKLNEGYDKYNDGLEKYNTGLKEFEDKKLSGLKELKDAKKKIFDGQKEYDDGVEKYNSEKIKADKKIKDAKNDLDEAKRVLKNMKRPTFNIIDRENIEGLQLFYDSGYRMDILALVFPAFFFLIASIVALTALMRMAEERRTQIGTFKALGYNNFDIYKKYLFYGFVATTIGVIIGIAIGQNILTKMVFRTYSASFTLKKPIPYFNIKFPLISIFISYFSIVVPVSIVLSKYLKQNSSELMRPKAPKSGSKIFLEKIPFFWKRLSFLYKVTFRNTFRYKSRMFMTLLGVAGCMSLLFFGFAIQGAVAQVIDRQYGRVFNYDLIVNYDKDFSKHQLKEYTNFIDGNEDIKDRMTLRTENLVADTVDMPDQNVVVMVIEDEKKFENYVHLLNKNKKIDLPKEGIVINRKLLDSVHKEPGDDIELRDAYNKYYSMKVIDTNENYLGHYAYMSKDYYEKIFNKKYEDNSDIIKLSSDSKEAKDTFIKELNRIDSVMYVFDVSKTISVANDWLSNLNYVIILIILTSATLAFVVLYNLNNVNISERIREVATLRVLGFYPRELTSYIYRETILLSTLGILLGYAGGIGLTHLILKYITPSNIQLVSNIQWYNYIVSAVLTYLFIFMVMIIVHKKLKGTDMVGALKAYE